MAPFIVCAFRTSRCRRWSDIRGTSTPHTNSRSILTGVALLLCTVFFKTMLSAVYFKAVAAFRSPKFLKFELLYCFCFSVKILNCVNCVLSIRKSISSRLEFYQADNQCLKYHIVKSTVRNAVWQKVQ